MRWIKLGAGALNQLPLDWGGNRQRAAAAIGEAREAGVSFLVLPELALSGYGCEDAFHAISTSRHAMESLLDLAEETRGMVVAVGLPVRLYQGLYNAVAFIVDGRVVGFVAKQYLAGDGIHYEPRYFRAWEAGKKAWIDVAGREVPFGDLIFDIGGVRVGAEICEDAWVPDRPGMRLAQAGCDIVANPSASHFALGKWKVRHSIVGEGSRSLAVSYVYANLLGNEAGRVIYDGEAIIAHGGDILARTTRLSFDELNVASAVVDVDLLKMRRARQTSFRIVETGPEAIEVDFDWPDVDEAPTPAMDKFGDWRDGPYIKEEEFARAVSLGLFDYLRKSRAGGFVVSLSGGADSAACATLAGMGFRLAVSEIGFEEADRRLPQLKLDPDCYSGGILDTAYQATANSGAVTRNAAQVLADALGARHSVWDVEAQVQGYRQLVEGTLGRPLTWEHDDITLQNIQARVRAPGIWMLANVRNGLLLTTSNRSEAAVGYATMDGDTAGSLAPIAGIDKYYLRRWLRWMAEVGPQGMGPLPQIAEVLELPPMAELRPGEARQTDEGDLMPYDLLDAIERCAIRDRLAPEDVYATLRSAWAPRVGGEEQLAFFVSRFFRLWCRNQWKRERYAPSFHLDDENLDPKTWCRFPILSSGYAEELQRLSDELPQTHSAGANAQ
ncbi:MAG: NAD(+) synthase [Sumerlaeia bacterium]